MSNIPDIKLNAHECYMGREDLKAAGVKLPWTMDMLKELARCQDDPIYFMSNYVKTSVADGGDLIPFKPYDYQKNLITSLIDNRFTICMAPRQHGKCFCPNTKVRIRRKSDKKIIELSIGDFYEWQKFRRCYKEEIENLQDMQ